MKRATLLTISFLLALTISTETQAITLGDTTLTSANLDGWQAIAAFEYGSSYTNATASAQTFNVTSASAFLQNTHGGNGVFTPFLMKWTGVTNNLSAYTVAAIGTSRTSAADWPATGLHTFAFNDVTPSFTLLPGETIMVAGMDSYANGNAGGGSTIPFANSGPGVWLNGGGGTAANLGPLVLGASPTAGGTSHGPTTGRQYQFNVTFEEAVGGGGVPEPASVLLLGMGVAGMCGVRRRRNA